MPLHRGFRKPSEIKKFKKISKKKHKKREKLSLLSDENYQLMELRVFSIGRPVT